MSTVKTTTAISATSDGKVIIQHSQPIGTQWLEPAEARRMAQALEKYAAEAERAGRHGSN